MRLLLAPLIVLLSGLALVGSITLSIILTL